MSNVDQWAVQFRTHGVTDPRLSSFTVGDGFEKFVADNDVAIGTLLVVEAVDDRCVVVTIHRREDENAPPLTPPPSPHTDGRPHFRKTLRACHTRPFKSTRLVRPLLRTCLLIWFLQSPQGRSPVHAVSLSIFLFWHKSNSPPVCPSRSASASCQVFHVESIKIRNVLDQEHHL